MAASNTKVSVTTASTSVLTTSFRCCVLTNYWVSGTIWIRIGQKWDAVVGEGIPLVAASAVGGIGGSFSINDDSLFQSPITAISSAGTNLLAVYSL